MKLIKQILKFWKNEVLHYIQGLIGYRKYSNQFRNSKAKKAYVIGTVTNGNLGDQAITYNQIKLLNELKAYEIREITNEEYWYARKYILKSVQPSDILCIQGGGNLGIEYWSAEEVRRDIIQRFPQNKVIIFPSTIDYGTSVHGLKEEMKSAKIYNRHGNLHIFAREKYSYNRMKTLYPQNHIHLVPDIVLKYDYYTFMNKREGIFLCLRSDVESVLQEQEKEQIFNIASKYSRKVKFTNTIINKKVTPYNRTYELTSKCKEIASSELLITDRLHGMVFAALTGTPCIIINNYNYKIKGVYEWIKELPYVRLINGIDELGGTLELLLSNKNRYFYSDERLSSYYEPLYNVLNVSQNL